MNWIEINSADDERLSPYRDLRDRALRVQQGRFIAEGWFLLERVLESRFELASVLVARNKSRRFAEAFGRVNCPVYAADQEVIDRISGIQFHQGVLACGIRGVGLTIGQLMAGTAAGEEVTVAVCPRISDPENLGSIIRSAWALGVKGLVVGEGCCDAFSRRCLRVSMGGALMLPIVVAADVIGAMRELREGYEVVSVATVLDADAPTLQELPRPARTAIVLGSEGPGLDREVAAACDARVRIAMKGGADSLNVAVAAALFMHHFTS